MDPERERSEVCAAGYRFAFPIVTLPERGSVRRSVGGHTRPAAPIGRTASRSERSRAAESSRRWEPPTGGERSGA